MPGGRKGAHIGPDFGDNGLDRNPTKPWHFVQSFDDLAKGRECACYTIVEGRNAFFQLFNCAQVLRKKKAMVLMYPAGQRLG